MWSLLWALEGTICAASTPGKPLGGRADTLGWSMWSHHVSFFSKAFISTSSMHVCTLLIATAAVDNEDVSAEASLR